MNSNPSLLSQPRRSLPGKAISLVTLLLATLLLAGCAPLSYPDAVQLDSSAAIAILDAGQTFGQSFTAQRRGLNGLTLWLAAAQPGEVEVKLYHTPFETQPIYQTRLPLDPVDIAGAVHLALPIQNDPDGQQYYVTLTPNVGPLTIMGRFGETAPARQASLNGAPLAAEAGYSLTYAYTVYSTLDDLRAVWSQAWLALPLALVLLAPGWLLLEIFNLRPRFAVGEQVALAVGLSLAGLPLVMLWTTVIGLHWTRQGVWFAFGLLAGALVSFYLARWLRRVKSRPTPLAAAPLPAPTIHQPALVATLGRLWPGLALAVIFTITLAVRLTMTRDLAAPAWVDSVHHAAITRLIQEQGAYPNQYSPYIDIAAVQYHPGFHAGLAFFQWLSGQPLSAAMLLYGQVLNALSVLAVYLLTTTLLRPWPLAELPLPLPPRTHIAGLLAALVVGVATPMPAYYVSWGRFTQLAGLIILPTGLALLRQLVVTGLPPRRRENIVHCLAAGLACAGLFLVHYRIAAFLGLLALTDLLSQLRFERAALGPLLRQVLTGYGVSALWASALAAPWLGPALVQAIGPAAQGFIATAPFSDFSWRYLNAAAGQPVLVLAGVGLIWGIVRRPRLALSLLLWVVLLFLLANLGAMGLPGARLVNTHTVTIMLFMPCAVLAGFLLSEAAALLRTLTPARFHLALSAALLLVTTVLSGLAARNLLPILNNQTVLLWRADLPALAWAAEHLPPNTPVAINPFAWGYGLYSGSDGGAWLPALAGHPTLPPPVLYGLGERAARQRINALSDALLNQGHDADAVWRTLQEAGIRYVYLGARGGALSPQVLRNSSRFKVLYSADGVWIFETEP